MTSSLNLFVYFVHARVALLSPLFLKISAVCLGLSQIDNYLLERDNFFESFPRSVRQKHLLEFKSVELKTHGGCLFMIVCTFTSL